MMVKFCCLFFVHSIIEAEIILFVSFIISIDHFASNLHISTRKPDKTSETIWYQTQPVPASAERVNIAE